jgi:hypothetical protein
LYIFAPIGNTKRLKEKTVETMDKKNTMSFTLIIVAIILGAALFKQFDFQQLRFEQPALAAIYLITFGICVSILIKNARKK